jgi:hypothetical protein
MKYFPPDLYVRFCSPDDAVADRAHAEWEKAQARYEKHLKAIRPALPKGLQKLVGELRLHDAELLALWRGKKNCLLELRLDNPDGDVVFLDYKLTEDPVLETDVLPAELRSRETLFLYDEVDVTRRGEKEQVCTHAILFGNGLSLRLSFTDVRISEVKQLFPAPDRVANSGVSRSA